MAGNKKAPAGRVLVGLVGTAIASGMIGLSFGAGRQIQVPAYRATRIIDGDTFETEEKQWIRVSGINAPEKGLCGYDEAAKELEKLVLNRDLYIKVVFHDSTRLMAIVYSKDGQVAEPMLASGWAVLDDKNGLNDPRLHQATELAQQKKLGVYSEQCSQTFNPVKPECNIKGNQADNGVQTYHLPGCQTYSMTKVDLYKDDQWFCTEAQAIKAGYKKAGQCP